MKTDPKSPSYCDRPDPPNPLNKGELESERLNSISLDFIQSPPF